MGAMSSDPVVRAEIVVDLAAVRANVRALAAHTGTPLMVVVKAELRVDVILFRLGLCRQKGTKCFA